MFCFGFGQNQNKTFFVLQWYFDLSKQKNVLVFVLTKPKQNRAGQLILREDKRLIRGRRLYETPVTNE